MKNLTDRKKQDITNQRKEYINMKFSFTKNKIKIYRPNHKLH